MKPTRPIAAALLLPLALALPSPAADEAEGPPPAPEAPKGPPAPSAEDPAANLEAEVLAFWAPIRPSLPKELAHQKTENRGDYEQRLRDLKNEMDQLNQKKAEHPEEAERDIRRMTLEGRIEHLREVSRESFAEERDKAREDLRKTIEEQFEFRMEEIRRQAEEARQEAERATMRSNALQTKIELMTKLRKELIESRLSRELTDVDYFEW